MDIKFDAQAKVPSGKTDTYMVFRTEIPKPPSEEAHLRHILRFYIARALLNRGEQDIYILPKLNVGGKQITVDVASNASGKYTLAICEPASVTPETEDMLDVLKDVDGIEVIIVHSQYGKPGEVMTRFKAQLESKKFKLLAVVPPPFDDVYEYDIWMFETTFRDLFEGS
jgi:hypothetical protein